MKLTHTLQIIYSFFLGLVVVGFVGIGVNTFYPQPSRPFDDYTEAYQASYAAWALNTSIILLVCATVVMAVSLVRAENLTVISNGLLLGGLFTMIYAVGMSIGSEKSVARFVFMAFALGITIGIGWLKFIRGQHAVKMAPGAEAAGAVPGELAARVDALEAKLDALGRALRP
ncbi:MAG: hypothetical protein ABI542_12435 [Gemmatimonadota bacterium]